MKLLKLIPDRLKSRKFWIAVFTIGLLIANEQYNEAVAVTLGYLGFQGLEDSVRQYKTNRVDPEYAEFVSDTIEEVDRSKVVSGK